MTSAIGLRLAAVAILMAGLVDPACRAVGATPRVDVVLVDEPSLDWPAADGGRRRDRAAASMARIARGLGSEHAVVRVVSHADGTPACLPDRPCVIVTAGALPERVVAEGSTLVGIVQVEDADGPLVAVRDVITAATQHPGAMGTMQVRLAGAGVRGVTSTVTVYDGAIPIGSARHAWGDAGGPQDAWVEIPWLPSAAGSRRLRVAIEPLAGDAVAQDDERTVSVLVEAARAVVLWYEARPSWAASFVRRALERDPRLELRSRTRVAPGLERAGGRAFGLEPADLDDASAVIVGAPDALTAAEVGALERYVAARGGSVILVPDQALAGPVMRLLPPGMEERLLADAVPVGGLRASELLVWPASDTRRALDRDPDGRVVVTYEARGAGRIVVAGALDAWRHRGGPAAEFDRYWQALVAGAAAAGADRIALHATPARARPGERVRLTATARSSASPTPAHLDMAAVVTCEGVPQPVRLWPAEGVSTFTGTFRAGDGPCRARVTVKGDVTGGAELLVPVDAAPAPDGRLRARALADRAGAVLVSAGDEPAVVHAARERLPRRSDGDPAHPMRSPWWMVPLTACLGGEWWLRRRAGLR
ncbi:MAG: hypothetical protein AB1635_04415 [Acidobacteriota bacterium]